MVASPPTQQGFVDFIRYNMGITTVQLPDNSPAISVAYEVSVDTVNRALWVAGPPIYALAVYNLAGDLLINYAPDSEASPGFFAGLREKFKIGNFSAGVITNASDEATSAGIEVVEVMKGLTIDQLQNLKTPWGRAYLGFAMKYGPSWGLS